MKFLPTLLALGAPLTVAATPVDPQPRDFIEEITHLLTGINVLIGTESFVDNEVTLVTLPYSLFLLILNVPTAHQQHKLLNPKPSHPTPTRQLHPIHRLLKRYRARFIYNELRQLCYSRPWHRE